MSQRAPRDAGAERPPRKDGQTAKGEHDAPDNGIVEDISERDTEPNHALADLVRRHIEVVYDGNQSAFARAVNLRQQYVFKLLEGGVGVPREPIRGRLARELGIPNKAFYVMSGDLTPDEMEGPWEARLDARKPMTAIEVEIASILSELSDARVRLVWELVHQLSGTPAAEELAGGARRG